MTTQRTEFLSLNSADFGLEEETPPSPIQSHLDTLFAEFTSSRRRRSPSLSRSPSPSTALRTSTSLRVPTTLKQESKVDLRALDYVSDYDSHLMCPICHVPFVDPLVLDCDHTFCAACFEEYRNGGNHSERSQCPTCRAYLLARPQRASRLIVNMCNDLRVRCPNEDCDELLPRGCIEQHATKDCADERLDCPDSNCRKMVKRKNFVPDQCIHSSHIECDCGAIIELGRGEWLKHKDEDCPTTGVKCDICEERISVKDYLAGRNAHICTAEATRQQCPGADYGCTDDFPTLDCETHIQTCPLARLAPTLKKQAQLLRSLNDQLSLTKVRNEVLETGLDKMNVLINDTILPNLLAHPIDSQLDLDNDVEEIPRHPPSPPPHSTGNLSLPAHLRPLTPTNSDLLSLHSSLQDNIGSLSSQLMSLQSVVAELDARTSMTMMNENLRLKEDLAHQSAGLFSTRAQVQWLLQRERERMVHSQQMAMQNQRGRATQAAQSQNQNEGQNGGSSSGTSSARTSISTDLGGQGDGVSLPSSSNTQSQSFAQTFAEASGHASGNVDAATRSPPIRSNTQPVPMAMPMQGTVGVGSPRVRPQMRRLSGGSQERVKL